MNLKIKRYAPRKSRVKIFYDSHITMRGEGIVKIIQDGERYTIDEFVEVFIDRISEDLPQFYDEQIGIYFGNATYFTYDLMFDAHPDVDLDIYYDWVNANYDIEFRDISRR